MGKVRPLPTLGGVFLDAHRVGRAMRVSWHSDAGVVVISLWDGPRCTATVHAPAAVVPELIHSLALGLSVARAHRGHGVLG